MSIDSFFFLENKCKSRILCEHVAPMTLCAHFWRFRTNWIICNYIEFEGTLFQNRCMINILSGKTMIENSQNDKEIKSVLWKWTEWWWFGTAAHSSFMCDSHIHRKCNSFLVQHMYDFVCLIAFIVLCRYRVHLSAHISCRYVCTAHSHRHEMNQWVNNIAHNINIRAWCHSWYPCLSRIRTLTEGGALYIDFVSAFGRVSCAVFACYSCN